VDVDVGVPIAALAMSADGRRLAVGGCAQEAQRVCIAGEVRLWEVAAPTAAPVVLTGPGGRVFSVAFSQDGRSLAAGSGDMAVWLWALDEPSALPIALTDGNLGPVEASSVAFNPDGQTLAAASRDASVRVWPMADRLADLVCEQVRRNLSEDEWIRFVEKGVDDPPQTCPGLPPGGRTAGDATPTAAPS
jgi:WD40 repeat protein